MKKIFALISLMITFYANPLFAKANDEICTEETYGAVARHFKIENFVPRNKGGVIVSESCKSWPYKRDYLLAAFAFDNGIEYEKSLIVAVLHKNTMRVVSSRQSVISEDAITEAGETSLQFDTARYQLSKDVRAFGLRFNSTARGPSCADAASWDELTLFVQDKNNLRPVLTMNMQFQNALSGCIGSATGNDAWEYGTKTISVENTASNGFADLRIAETVIVDTNMEKLPSNINVNKRVNSYVVKYNGKEYSKQ
jgi:hypothetical protein